MFAAIYLVFLTGALTLAWSWASRANRTFVGLISVAAIATFVSHLIFPTKTAEFITISIDLAVFVGGFVFAICSAQWWVIWFAGLQTSAVLTRIAALLAPTDQLWLFSTIAAFWIIPILVVILVGLHSERVQCRKGG